MVVAVLGVSGSLAVVVLIAYLTAAGGLPWKSGPKTTPRASGIAVGLHPGAAVDRVTARMAEHGFVVLHKGKDSATFSRPKRANTGVGCLLLLLGLVPGLLYFGLFRGTRTVSVVAVREGSGARLVTSGDDAAARRDLERWASKNMN